MPVVNANSVDPDHTPRFVASDLGLHCLLVSHLWNARHKWVYYCTCLRCLPSVVVPVRIYSLDAHC